MEVPAYYRGLTVGILSLSMMANSAYLNLTDRFDWSISVRIHISLLRFFILHCCSYSAIDMSTFEALKLAYLRSTGKDEPGVLALLAFGSISGSVGATSVYPLNLVRTRLQASGSSGHPQRYNGIFDVALKTYERDGWRGVLPGTISYIG